MIIRLITTPYLIYYMRKLSYIPALLIQEVFN